MLLIVATIFSCKKDDNDNPDPGNPLSAYIKTATYSLNVDNQSIAEGSCSGISTYPGVEKDNTIILFKGSVMVLTGEKPIASITGVPYVVGEEEKIDYNNIGLVFFNIGTEKKMFIAKSGAILRESNNEIVFSGMGYYSSNKDDLKEFSGMVSSKVVESIVKK